MAVLSAASACVIAGGVCMEPAVRCSVAVLIASVRPNAAGSVCCGVGVAVT